MLVRMFEANLMLVVFTFRLVKTLVRKDCGGESAPECPFYRGDRGSKTIWAVPK